MKYENFSSKDISKMGLGTLRFSINEDGECDLNEAENIIDTCMKAGITYYDTGHGYLGFKAEEILNSLLVKRYNRKSFFLADKLHVHDLTTSAEDLFNTQLASTGAGYFDFYLVHGITDITYEMVENERLFSLIKSKKEEGLIHHIGASFHSSYEIFKTVLDKYDELIEFVQLPLSYYSLSQDDVKKQYELAKEKGKKIIAMGPLHGGFLSNIENVKAKEITKELCKKYSVTESQLGMMFTANLPEVICILSGIATSSQAKENIEFFNEAKEIAPEDMEKLLECGKILKNTPHIDCTKCGYCRSCPSEIKIPKVFTHLNRLMEARNSSMQEIARISIKENLVPSKCLQCDKCLAVCPQGINVPEFMRNLCLIIEKEAELDYPKYIPVTPSAYEMEDRLVSDILDVHIAADNKELSDKVKHIIAIRLKQKISGEEVSHGWTVLKCDEKTSYSLPMFSYENGIYELLVRSVYDGEKDGKPHQFYSPPQVYTFTLFKKNTLSVTRIYDGGNMFYEYGEEAFEEKESKTYLGHIVDGSLPEIGKGMFLELGVMHSQEGLYHQISACLVVDGIRKEPNMPVIFPVDKTGKQISGNKFGIVFIPMELAGTEEIKVHLDFREYADAEFTDCLEVIEEVLTLDNFRQALYLDFTEKTPSIFFSEKREERVTKDVASIYFKDIIDEKHVPYVRVIENEITDGWKEVNSLHHQVYLDKKGEFTVQAKVTDYEENILCFKEKKYVISENVRIKMKHADSVRREESLDIAVKIDTPLDVKDLKLIHKDEGILIPHVKESEKSFTARYMVGAGIPTGLHILLAEALLSDGTKVTKTTTFNII